MRVLVATDQWFPDVKTGVSRVAADSARELARRGHDVTVLAPAVDGEAREASEALLSLRRVLDRRGVPQTLADPMVTARRARALGSRFDVALAHQPTTAAGLWAARLRVPLVLVFHASPLRELRYRRKRLPFGAARLAHYALEPALMAVEPLAVSKAARILVFSEFSRSILAADHPREAARARRVGAGVDTRVFSPEGGPAAARERLGVAPKVTLLVTARRFEPRMGLEQLVRAVPRLRESRDVVLVLVGAGILERELRALVASLGLADHVRFPGRVPDAELRDWYRAADLFVLPTVAYEGFGMVTAEALACGTPVVGTPVGATPELLEGLDPRLVARGTGSDDLARAIADVLPLLGDDFRRRCREYACARFGWENVIEEWEEALEELAAPADAAVPTAETARGVAAD